ncbi:uncharacterized protein C12orf71 homolog isoform X1 [Alexandromys fortis]|uniref:uncharacterized protein C12orf71 homolog isoform X1 n=1 Tax=Alexandromys fortis TaxID=100897 RepID=UPI0021533CB3|nr:uncharacterized protein C12orf71 homolog isoform X1 [Microtus fortis]
MTTSPSSSDDSGTEDSVSDCKSDQSLSTGYFPTENTFSYREMASYGEMASCEETASGNPSLHLLPPNQGSWGTGSVRRLFRKQDQMKEDREQFCKLSISLAWDTNVSSDQADTLANPDLNGQWQWMDRWPKDRTKLTPCKLDNLVQKLETFLEKEKGSQHDSPLHPESTQKEDVHLTSVPPPQKAWVRHEKHGICQDLPKHKTPKNKESCQAPENPPRLREDEVMQEIGQAAKSSLETSSVVPIHHGEDSSHSYGTSCLNLRWVFHWLRTQVFSRLRREHSSQDTTSWHQKAARKIHSLRGNRIQPQE